MDTHCDATARRVDATHTHSTSSRRCHALRSALRPAPPRPRAQQRGAQLSSPERSVASESLLRGGLGSGGGGGGGSLGGGGGGGGSSGLGLGLHLPKLHDGQQPVAHHLAHEGARSERR